MCFIFPIPSQSYTTSSFPVTVKIICFLYLLLVLEKQSQFQESKAYVLDVNQKELENSESAIISKEIEQKANDLDIMVDLMKEKIKVSSRKVKIQILTMTPCHGQ